MPGRRPVTAFEVIKVLRGQGFDIARRKGSHVRMVHPDGRKTSVPVHGKEPIGVGLLLRILKDANISKEDFFRLAEEV
jgi:predicted RNA binding protein YcfA (HicA-like mRNA interferase family)